MKLFIEQGWKYYEYVLYRSVILFLNQKAYQNFSMTHHTRTNSQIENNEAI